MSLGRMIARIRTEKGLRQADVAETLGVHQSYVARIERDQMRPRSDVLEKLAKVLETPVEELQAADQKLSSRLLEQHDPELVDLFRQAHRLEDQEREALKTFLKSMLMRADLEDALGRALDRTGRTLRPSAAPMPPGKTRGPRAKTAAR